MATFPPTYSISSPLWSHAPPPSVVEPSVPPPPDALGSVTDLLTEDTLNATVTPFETAAPPESEIAPHEIENEVFLRRVGDSVEARGFQSQVESALRRPDADVDSSDLGLADAAVAGAEGVAGGYFTPGGEACDPGLSVTPRDEVLHCTSVVAQQYQACRETRAIYTDRDDLWACSTEDLDYKKHCARDVTWTCTGEQGPTCIASALTLPSSGVWRTGATGFDVAGTASTDNACTLQSDTFIVTAQGAVDLRGFLIDQLAFYGAAQIRVNGTNIWTHGTSATGNLNIRTRDCGKDCSRPAAYAGGTWIEDCGSSLRYAAGTDILAVHPGPTRGPSAITDHAVTLPPSPATTWTIEILRINRTELGLSAGFALQGSCCAAWDAQTAGACE